MTTLLAQAATIPAPSFGGALSNLVDQVTADSNGWLVAAQTIMYVLFSLLVGLSVVFALARSAVQNQSIAAWGHVFPNMLMDLLPPWCIVFAAPAFSLNTLSVGLGLGSALTGQAITGPSAMATVFIGMIGTLLAAPFGPMAASASAATQPTFSWQYLTTLASIPPEMLMGVVMEGAAILMIAFLIPVAIVNVAMLLWVEIDALVVMPLALLLVPFVANQMTSGLWQGALQTWVRRVFRLAMAVIISSFSIAMFQHFADQLTGLNPLDYKTMLTNEFSTLLIVCAVGAVTAGLPFALDSAILGHLMPAGIDVNRHIFRPAARVAQAYVTKKAA